MLFSEQNLRRTGIIAICGLIVSALVFGSSVMAGDQERPRSTQPPAANANANNDSGRPAHATQHPTPQTHDRLKAIDCADIG